MGKNRESFSWRTTIKSRRTGGELVSTHRYQGRAVGDHDSGSFQRDEMLIPEIAECASDRLACRPYARRNLFMRQGNLDLICFR